MKKVGFFLSFFFVPFFTLYALRIPLLFADQNISVTGSIPPKASDFQLSFASNTSGTQNQKSVITFTITYGSHLYYTDQMQIDVQWDKGTIQGSSTPVDGMDYVIGSASKAYNGTAPIVDLNQRKIDWVLPSFPAQTTDQTVTFSLAMNGSYQGLSHVNFPVKVRLTTPQFTTQYQSISLDYLFNPSLVPVQPTPTPQPTLIPSPALAPTYAPAPTAITPSFLNVNFFNLLSNEADINYITNQIGNVTILFGTSPQALTPKQILSGQNSGIFSLDNLQPQHTYFFQLFFSNKNGSATSEVFSFTTPKVSTASQVVKTSLVIASDNDVLYSAGLTQNSQETQSGVNAPPKNPTLAIAPTTNYTLAFKITQPTPINSIKILFQNNSVLGISTAYAQGPAAPQYFFGVNSKGNGVYAANITNTIPPGSYNVFIVISDTAGNVTTQEMASVHVLHPFQVYRSTDKGGIEDVRIVLYQYDAQSKQFRRMQETSSFHNPIYTDRNGMVSEQLTPGKYKAVASRIGYQPQTVMFSLGLSTTDDFPTLYLAPTPITIQAVVTYYRNAFTDWLAATNDYVNALHASYRFFDLISLASLFCFAVLMLLLFSFKTHIHFLHVPYYFHHHMLHTFGVESTPYLHGTIVDADTKLPLSKALVIAMHTTTHDVAHEALTNKAGSFLLPYNKAKYYILSVVADGYQPIKEIPYQPHMVIPLIKGSIPHHNRLGGLWNILENLSGLLFAFLLVASFVLQLILFPAFGLSKTLPFLLVSILNIALWFFYIKESREK